MGYVSQAYQAVGRLWKRLPNSVKCIAGVIGAIIISAVGNGVWIGILQPMGGQFLGSVQNLFANLSSGYVETAHVSIGEGLPLTSGIEFMFFGILISILIAIVMMLISVGQTWAVMGKAHEATWKAHEVISLQLEAISLRLLIQDMEQGKEGISLEKRKKEIEQASNLREDEEGADSRNSRDWRRFRTLFVFGIFLLLLTMIFYSLFYFSLYSYQSSAVTFIEQSIEILSPYISSSERLELRALYRSVNTADKFYRLESKLKDIANGRGISLPNFESLKSRQ